ncbi:hypothetical protein JTB14_016015 [Gonioctena quinquepunctata]|nr:hypothetical protein JTB14_016015 [Gonioctena quinquepunctata]
MSMLAERKRKQKWSLNPRGKEWSQDANKFGQKMLEKMGWQHGKGLGAKESGITEHIKIPYKNDSRGMGYKESNDQWTEHDTNFSALLESLSGENTKSVEVKVNSLEKKSQTSRARVHYHKFTRGKDLSRYSEKDLANIFGKKSLKKEKNEICNEIKEEENETQVKDSGFLLNGGSMRDYFRKKLPNFGKNNGYMVGSNGVLKKDEDSESESDIRSGFGFGFKSECPIEEKDKSTFISYVKEESVTKRKAEESVEDLVFSPKKKSKKDKKCKKSGEDMGLSNPSFNPLATPIKLEKHILEPIEESSAEGEIEGSLAEGEIEENIDDLSVVKEKRKKKLKNVKNFCDSIEENETLDESVERTSEENTRKKRKTAETDGRSNPSFNDILESSYSEEIENNPFEIKAKKKKKKKVTGDCTKEYKNNEGEKYNETHCDSQNSDEKEEINVYEVKVAGMKKRTKLKSENSLQVDENILGNKKRKKNRNEALENPGFDDSVENSEHFQIEENPYEIKIKKKKKNMKLPVDNPNFVSVEDVIDFSQAEENPYEVRRKKAKKVAVENPGFLDSVEPSTETAENPYEIKVKKKKKSKNKSVTSSADNEIKKTESVEEQRGITNPALNLNDTVENSTLIEDSDMMLNIVSTPVMKQERSMTINSVTKVETARRRKSVRFSDVTQELIIPNNEELRELYENVDSEDKSKKKKRGVDNVNFDKQKTSMEENLDSISKTLERYQAEIENDINEGKLKTVTMEDIMVGEVGNPHGENEKLPEGTKLKFKYANLNSKTPLYHLDKVGPKKAYKHLIKGDILLKFKDTNLHEIQGYGVRLKSER